MEEIWKDIPGYEGQYQVSNLGRVKSLDRFITQMNHGKLITRRYPGKIFNLKPDNTTGYVAVVLHKDNVPTDYLVHRLVAQSFIPNPDNFPQVNHKDENTSNNCVDNLEWCTNSYNVNYGSRNEKVRNSLKGIQRSEEWSKRQSESHKGKPAWNKGITKPVICLDQNITFASTAEAAAWLGDVGESAVQFAAKRVACCGGHVFVYTDNIPKDIQKYVDYCYTHSRQWKHLASKPVYSLD